MLDLNENNTLNKLKEKFTIEQLKEIAFAFDPEKDDIKSVIDNLNDQLINSDLKEFYIEKQIKKINGILESQFEYYCTEDYLSEYFTDYDNNDVQINYSDYQSENEEIKEFIIPLINSFYEKDFIDICEFEIDYSYWQPEKAIFFSIGNLGEFENQLDDEISEILNGKYGKEIKSEILDYIIPDNNEYAYSTAPTQILYHIDMDRFISNCIDNIDCNPEYISEYKKDIENINDLCELIDIDDLSPETKFKINVMTRCSKNNNTVIGFFAHTENNDNSGEILPNDIFIALNKQFNYDVDMSCYCPIGQHSGMDSKILIESDIVEISKKEYIELSGRLYTPDEYISKNIRLVGEFPLK